MLNSNIPIVFLLGMWAAIDSTGDLLGMILGPAWRAVDAKLAAVPIGMSTKQPTPMTHLAPAPTARFDTRNGGLDLLVGVRWSRHRLFL
jgi:hypothetical protein